MSIETKITQAQLSPLAQQFTRFCQHLDSQVDNTVLATIAVLAHRNAKHGDTCLNLAALAELPLLLRPATEEEIEQPLLHAPTITEWRQQLAASSIVGQNEEHQPLILDGTRLYLYRYFRDEKIIVKELQQRMIKQDYDTDTLKQRLDSLFDTSTTEKMEQTQGQKIAAAMALTRKLTIITGGPGTGKTTTVTKILALLLETNPKLRIMLAAPTGKAAARLSESIIEQTELIKNAVDTNVLEAIPKDASTIHRMLGWQRDGFVHNAENHLPCDCLLLDETSMIDLGMMAKLLSALPEHCRLIMLGDRDQLESVEAGSVLGDITGHGQELSLTPPRFSELDEIITDKLDRTQSTDTPQIADHIAHLNYSHRFAGGGGIGRLSDAVNNSDYETAITVMQSNDPELGLIEISRDTVRPGSSIINLAVEYYSPIFDAKNAEEALKIFETSRVLTALRQGPWGETEIGKQIENQLRNKGYIKVEPGQPYRGMPIIIRSNDRETGLFNGDTGIFWPEPKSEKADQNDSSDKKQQNLMAWFRINGELKSFSVHQLPNWQSAWTLTVHRSQGSQYQKLILVLPSQESKVLSPELIYTGITRAQKHCTLVINTAQFEGALENRIKRTSGLGVRMGWP